MAQLNMDRLLQACVEQGASDIHITVGRPPVFGSTGNCGPLRRRSWSRMIPWGLMKSITPERCQQELQEEGGTDFGFAFGDAARFRVSVFKQKGNTSIVLRQIPSKILTFDEIGLPKIISALCRRPRGLFLVTGPTGSGKTTTLATMINYINETVDRHIVTVEDPIEYYHHHKKCIINQREVGTDVPSFGEALRRVLRMDPDVILVGELRDLETIEAALRAAETGHLVFSTLHTTSAAGTITRIIDVFPVRPAGTDSYPAQQQPHCRALSRTMPAGHRQGTSGSLRVHGGHAGHRQPHPREQDLSNRLQHPDWKEVGHAAPGRAPVAALR